MKTAHLPSQTQQKQYELNADSLQAASNVEPAQIKCVHKKPWIVEGQNHFIRLVI